MQQPGRPPVTIQHGPGGMDSADLLGGPVPAERRPRSWRGALTAAIGVSATAVAGTGIALAVALSGGGPQPEDVLPGDTFALVKVDLDPAGEQKIAAYELARRFPDMKVGDARNLPDDLLRRLLAGNDDIDFDKQVEPWIGARAAVAGVPDTDGDGDPELLVALAYDDRKAAERLLPELVATPLNGQDVFFAFSEQAEYVLFAESQQAADTAAQPKQLLADAPGFQRDVAQLQGEQVALAWADLGALWKHLPEQAREAATTAYGAEFSMTGRGVTGVHLSEDAVQVSGRTFGVDLGNDALTNYALGADSGGGLAGDLPADAVAAVSVAGLGRQVQDLFELVASSALGGAQPADLDTIGEQFGLKIPEDLAVLLGDETALGIYKGAEGPEFGVRTRSADPARGLQVAERLMSSLSQQSTSLGGQLTFEQCAAEVGPTEAAELCEGLPPASAPAPIDPPDLGQVAALPDGLAYGSTREVLDKVTGSGGLGQTERFRQVVPGADQAATAIFVDLQAALAMFDGSRPGLEALDALGVSSRGGPDGRFEVRLTLR